MDILEIKDKLKEFYINQDYIDKYEEYYLNNSENMISNAIDEFSNLYSIYLNNDKLTFRAYYISVINDIQLLITVMIHYHYYLKSNKSSKDEDVRRVAKFCMDIYVPIIARLGMYSIKSEMEDLIFYVLEKDKYLEIASMLKAKKTIRDDNIKQMVEKIKQIVGNDDYDIYGRSKHIYSIYRKLSDKEKDITSIFDLFAIRIIVPTVNDCYFILGEINEEFEPKADRFKDYIAKPKPNGYQSIHTVIENDEGQLFEIQIRTENMHKDAELGIAAHFAYKEKKKIKSVDESLLEFRGGNYEAKQNEKEIFALTPQDKLIKLQKGNTIIDYAFLIHTEVGNNMVGAIVNGEIKNLNYEIHNSDVIKILTKKNSSGPSLEWVEMCTSMQTKRKIKSFLRKKEVSVSELALEEGHKILVKELLKENIDPNIISESKIINKILRELKYEHINYVYRDLYEKKIRASELIKTLNSQKKITDEIKLSTITYKEQDNDVEVVGAYGIKTDIAKCCHPIYGDEIVAVVKQGESFKIHKKTCTQVNYERALSARWNIQKQSDTKYLCSIRILVDNDDTNAILTSFSKHKIAIVKLLTKEVNEYKVMYLNIYLHSIDQYAEIKSSILNLENVISIERV